DRQGQRPGVDARHAGGCDRRHGRPLLRPAVAGLGASAAPPRTVTMELDRLDTQILNILQDDASVPLRALAGMVHASVATCQRRIAQLRASGVLIKDVALVDRVRVGRPLTAFVSVELDQQNTALLKVFESLMRQEPDVMACYEVAGEFDFMLVVTAASMDYY